MALIPLGILSAAGAGGGATGTFELIESYVLGSAQASITFSNLGTYSSTYKHLQIRATARSDQSTSGEYINIRLNAATSFFQHGLEGNGSSVTSYGGSTSSMAMALMANSAAPASAFGGAVIDILDPYSTTKNKTLRGLGGLAATNIALRSGLWASTDSVTSIICLPFSAANWVAGSRFSLYGIR